MTLKRKAAEVMDKNITNWRLADLKKMEENILAMLQSVAVQMAARLRSMVVVLMTL